VLAKDVDVGASIKAVDQRFLLKLLELFDSDDGRERECLKTILIKIHARYAPHRTFIRRSIQNACLAAAYEGEVQNGTAELLEVFAKVISGFAVPLKEEHRQVLFRVLNPLHKLDTLGAFHAQLVECIQKYVGKDPKLAHNVALALLRFWPFSQAAKELLFLRELEEMLNAMPQAQLQSLRDALAKRLAACVSCPNSDVAERALNLCKNERVTKLMIQHCRECFPVVISALYENATQHWADPVHRLTIEVLKLLMEADPELFDHSSAQHRREQEQREEREAVREKRWAHLQELHDRQAKSALPTPTSLRIQQGVSWPKALTSAAEASEGARPGHRAPGSTEALGRQRARSAWCLVPKAPVPLAEGRYSVVASWPAAGAVPGLELQALLVSDAGSWTLCTAATPAPCGQPCGTAVGWTRRSTRLQPGWRSGSFRSRCPWCSSWPPLPAAAAWPMRAAAWCGWWTRSMAAT